MVRCIRRVSWSRAVPGAFCRTPSFLVELVQDTLWRRAQLGIAGAHKKGRSVSRGPVTLAERVPRPQTLCMKNTRFLHLLTALLSALVVSGCTSSKEAPAPSNPTPVAETKPAPKAAAPVGPVMLAEVADNVVELGAGDDMKYDANEIRVEQGKKVTVNLKHSGKLPAAQMGHNFVLLRKGVDLTQFALKAMNSAETGYIPEGDDVIAHTKIIGGGESTSITFEAPEPGTYEFLCTFPGHFGVMQGKFVVS